MKEIFLAPFSNSHIRDWPLEHFTALAGLLLQRVSDDTVIQVVGAPNQRLRAAAVVRPHPADRVINACGRLTWDEVVARMRHAICVVSNNSGIGHLGGAFEVPTVCVFGGSHQRREWRPLGPSVVLVSHSIGCSPCQLDHLGTSPYNKACLRKIEPATVADAALAIIAKAGGREAA